MRTLNFRKPYKPNSTQVQKEYLNQPTDRCFERHSSVITKYGIVLISELDWDTNDFPTEFTFYSTMINGMVYTADSPEARLSDRQRKWMATHFMKQLIKEKQLI